MTQFGQVGCLLPQLHAILSNFIAGQVGSHDENSIFTLHCFPLPISQTSLWGKHSISIKKNANEECCGKFYTRQGEVRNGGKSPVIYCDKYFHYIVKYLMLLKAAKLVKKTSPIF